MINEGAALDITKRYYNLLQKTGYAKHINVLRFLMYVFILDFVDYTHSFFTEEDYDTVDRALRVLFADGGCLMPYEVFCANRATLGRNEYMGTLRNRITEDNSVDENGNPIENKDRYTQDDYIRVI